MLSYDEVISRSEKKETSLVLPPTILADGIRIALSLLIQATRITAIIRLAIDCSVHL